MATTYKQGDLRWSKKIVGFGNKNQTFENVGCTVCDITYLHNTLTGEDLTPLEVNQRLKDVGAFVGAAVYWKLVPLAFKELTWKYRDYNFNNPLVWSWIHIWPKVPVLAEVYEPRSVTKRHWVLLLGNKKLYNSITGSVQPTSVYRTWTGSARFSRS